MITTTQVQHYPSYINGEWLDSRTRGTIEVENPATGEVFATVSDCTPADAQYALETSKRAQASWQLVPAHTRGQYIMA